MFSHDRLLTGPRSISSSERLEAHVGQVYILFSAIHTVLTYDGEKLTSFNVITVYDVRWVLDLLRGSLSEFYNA